MDQPVCRLGVTTFRRSDLRFGIKQHDRLSHTYIIGKTGVGKSSLLGALARQDAAGGQGFALIDPHGDLVDEVWRGLSPAERERTTYFDATNPSCSFGYNPLRRVRDDRIPLAASGLLEAMKKLWPDAWGVRMEHVLRNSLFALLERDGSALPDILRLYRDKTFRREVALRVRNPVVRAFWLSEFKQLPDRYAAEMVAPVQNKLGALLTDPMLYRTLVGPLVDMHFRSIMDRGGILLVNLSIGRIGSDSSNALGSLLVSTLGLAALSRADDPPHCRRQFFIHIDEFPSFATLSFVNLMSELRKFGAGLTLVQQHLAQVDPEVRSAVFGNVGTMLCFRIGAEDAPFLAREFAPEFEAYDLLNLPNYHFYLKLMIDGMPSRPLSARLLPECA